MTNNEIIDVKYCPCGLGMEPQLINVATFSNPPQWVITWSCSAQWAYGHEALKKANRD